MKGTPLEDAKIELGGTAAVFKDMSDGAKYDLMIAGISALCLIFLIMLLITRSFVASLVIVGTVALSLGASFGLSVIIWQYILGIELHWLVMQMAIIVLLAVGSDYNLLLVSRLKEELHGGLKTGIIRSMGGTGSVVTSAGLVFAFTMAVMVVSDLRIIGQVGTTIALGLLFDTLIVRSFMTPAVATLLGRWFWWPLNVRTRPLPPPRTTVAADPHRHRFRWARATAMTRSRRSFPALRSSSSDPRGVGGGLSAGTSAWGNHDTIQDHFVISEVFSPRSA